MRNLQRIINTGVIAVIRAESPDQALQITDAVMQGGIDIIEVTFTVPGATRVIDELRKIYGDKILLGAGTVLDPETARIALMAGAEYIVSPAFNPDVIKLSNRYQKLCMPGCMTISEIVSALEAGADVIKLFPGSNFGPSMIKTIKGPLPQAEFIPTGGVSLDNVHQWIGNGCLAVGVGGELTRGVKEGDFKKISDTAREFVKKVRDARSELRKED